MAPPRFLPLMLVIALLQALWQDDWRLGLLQSARPGAN